MLRIHPRVIGIDIGGANLKLADTQGNCLARSFAMWTDFLRLENALAAMFQEYCSRFAAIEAVAITLTGELADCFESRRHGVCEILWQVQRAAPNVEHFVYGVNGGWLSTDQAIENAWAVAASNWAALANWVCQANPTGCQPHMIVDIGSTTTDVIPLRMHKIATDAKTDRDRLQRGQLVYTGIHRTPVAAVTNQLMIDGRRCPLMAERFATVDDAYLVLGLVAEDSGDCDSADGRSRTVLHAGARLARMIGEDRETLTDEQLRGMAEQIVDIQARQIADAIEQNAPHSGHAGGAIRILESGHGTSLFSRAIALASGTLQIECQSLAQVIGVQASRSAPALAVAWLLTEALRQSNIDVGEAGADKKCASDLSANSNGS
ncbi:MAG: hypothetical protein KDB22_11710 [Planctomycetales bacterium]|nr:hypothetical protein [Planctomycetales bacterium]